MFDASYWKARDCLVGAARGRGSAYLIETEYGAAVLKQYLRGGWPARFSRDRYLFTGYQRSRPLAEIRVLAHVSESGLPAPEPLAALCERQGLFCRGWLLSRRIPHAQPLADLLSAAAARIFRRTGATIRRFHDAGVVHADLNVRNILVDDAEAIHLVDFDRARVGVNDRRAFRANLQRLHRSLEKLWPPQSALDAEAAWQELLSAYSQQQDAR